MSTATEHQTRQQAIAAGTMPAVTMDFDERAEAVARTLRDDKVLAVFRHAVQHIDRDRLRTIQDKYRRRAEEEDRIFGLKYLDFAHVLAKMARTAVQLGLHEGPARRILDIGAGGGHLAFIARLYGHAARITDLPWETFDDAAWVLGFEVVHHASMVNDPVPLDGPFDLVTLTGVKLDTVYFGQDPYYWDGNDWQAFLSHLAPKVAKGGRIHLKLNKGGHARANIQRFAEMGAAADVAALTATFTLDGQPAWHDLNACNPMLAGPEVSIHPRPS